MKNFEFPLPPSGLLTVDAATARRWPCEVAGWGANGLSGRLLTLDVEQQLIKVQGLAAKAPTGIRFNQFKSLRIDGGMRLVGANEAGIGVGHRLTFLPFAVRLIDGSRLLGETAGAQDLPSGLWLFVKSPDGDSLSRLFVPRAALESYEAADVATGGVDPESYAATDFSHTVQHGFADTTLDFSSEVVNSAVETRADLLLALERQARIKPVPIGEALIGLGKVTAAQLAVALKKQKDTKNVPLGQILVDMGMVSTADLQAAFARKMGYPMVELKTFEYDVAALRMVPLSLALRLKVQPLMLNKGLLVVAMPDPLQFKVLEEIEFTTQLKVMPVLCTGDDIGAKISRTYREVGLAEHLQDSNNDTQHPSPDAAGAQQQDVFQLASELVVDHSDNEDERQIEQSDNTLVRLINSMILEAYQQGASDIHIEPYPGRQKLKIRFRIDGKLRPYLELPASYRSALIARIKIMCDLDISEKRKAQDGKINFAKFGGLKLELRVATIPTSLGLEDVVMRILASSRTLALGDIGLSKRNLTLFTQAIERPYGMVLCVGPTGSGKTTTLHSALHHLNKPERKIWTAEDPVEITQQGLRQIQVNPKIGWSFATSLRALLRADPDVIMVGEIRDAETAQIAVEASLTGHLVMSTLHTNTAAETITRLVDLGLDPFSFSDSILAVMAQRLVRRLCPHCMQRHDMNAEELEQLTVDFQSSLEHDDVLRDRSSLHRHWIDNYGKEGRLQSVHSPGCEKCGRTGFRGRLAIHELLVVSPSLRHLIQQRSRSEQLMHQALAEGMRTLRQDGIEKVLLGQTTLAEVRANSNA